MGYEVDIDVRRQRVESIWRGVVDEAMLFAYIDEVWRDPECRGFDELIDFSAVSAVNLPNAAIAALADYSRQFDNPDYPARSALVAGDDLAYGLSRMFASTRAADPDDRRDFQVFAKLDAARSWLAEGRMRSA